MLASKRSALVRTVRPRDIHSSNFRREYSKLPWDYKYLNPKQEDQVELRDIRYLIRLPSYSGTDNERVTPSEIDGSSDW